ncbi:5-formyltetrahydrofolate cyclo-ligase [uncultured Polaribacter sp.]|uniref:5-formyltetrahydrofolate cyclo-ligase n=1 Tax=uncultured Polaribacter sp. TaxID=174711 RepID=UPI0026065608|nr:5-formyltetrahydrofolate cyclo-ligase [uncultured Polaribacter sp.]
MKKQQLRKIYKQKRADLTESQIIDFQKSIYQQIYNLDITNVENVHIFLSLTKFKEIDTQPIINYFRSKHINLVVSKSDLKNHTLSHYYLEENTVLKENKYKVLEPINAQQVDEKELDIIFVPLLISDELNYRIGYGKGFYDRFLANCKKEAKFIGINYFKPIHKIEDVNNFDIPLHQVIYPK